MSKSTAENIRPLAPANGASEHRERQHGEIQHGETKHSESQHSERQHGETKHGETKHDGEARAEQVRVAEELARLEAAFPWSGTLPLAERARFARELADHPKRATDRDLDRLLAMWRARARAYEHGHGRGLRAA